MKFGILLVRLNPSAWADAVAHADALGFESAWIADHLVFPVTMRGELVPGEAHPPVDAATPVYDVPTMLSYLAARTEHIRLGTYVYLLGIRHPFVTARGFATLDIVSNGRCELGVGAGWLRNEWEAAGFDPRTRGRRLDEALHVVRRLWTESIVEHHGEFCDFEPVMFEPKPRQRPHPPIAVGGESLSAIRRAVMCDGWMALVHTPQSAAPLVARYREHETRLRPDHRGVVTVCGPCRDQQELREWEALGVDRLIVAPWTRTSDVIPSLSAFAARFIERR
jgi:probable F420-dependent oxidoreductase